MVQASPVPVYVSMDMYFGSGVVGGMVHETQAIATRAAAMVVQILAGTRAQDIPIEHPALVPAFDWRQMKRWGISESRLPAGSKILFRPPGAWELYRSEILGGGALFVLESGLIGLLLVQRSRRRRTEARNSAILRALPDLMFLQTIDGVYVDYHASDPAQLLSPPSSSWERTCATHCQRLCSARSRPDSRRRPAPRSWLSPSSSSMTGSAAGESPLRGAAGAQQRQPDTHAGARHHRAGASRKPLFARARNATPWHRRPERSACGTGTSRPTGSTSTRG